MPAVGQCAICFSTLLSTETFAIIKCGHTFHQNCIKQWIKTGKNCSSCRVKCSERDVIKLFIQETNLDDTFSQQQQHNSEAKVLEMEHKLERTNQKLKKIATEKENIEADYHNLKLQIKEKDRKLQGLPKLQLQVQNIHMLEEEKADLQRKLKEAERKLSASEFYDMLNRRDKGPDEYKKYVGENGGIIDQEFLKLMRKERDGLKKRLDETYAELKEMKKELKDERKISLQRKEALVKLKADFKNLNEAYNNGNKRDAPRINPKLRDIINYSPEPKRSRPSLGFAFESPVIPVNVLNSGLNEKRTKKRIINDSDDEENDVEYKQPVSRRRPTPSPPKKQKPFNFESDSDGEWRPSASSTSIMSVPTPVQRFTRNTSSSKDLGSKFGTTLTDKRPAATPLKKPSTQQIKTRSMDKFVLKSSRSSRDADDSVVCLD